MEDAALELCAGCQHLCWLNATAATGAYPAIGGRVPVQSRDGAVSACSAPCHLRATGLLQLLALSSPSSVRMVRQGLEMLLADVMQSLELAATSMQVHGEPWRCKVYQARS